MPVSVTKKIKEIMAHRDASIITAEKAVEQLLIETRRQILVELVSIPDSTFSAWRLEQSLSAIERQLSGFESSARSTVGSGLTATWEAGAELLPEAAGAAGVRATFYHLSTHTLDSLKAFTFGKISSVSGDLYNKIRGELSLGALGQKSPAEVAAALTGGLEGIASPKDKWGNPIFKSAAERAETITKTELGRTFSLATNLSGEAAADTLPDLEKVWLHAGHPKVGRVVHIYLHGEKRAIGKPFYQARNGYGVQFPRDPAAHISDVIGCGCTHIFWSPVFGALTTFVNSFDRTQNDLWTGKKAA